MGIRTFAVASFTTGAVADTQDLADNTFLCVKGGASTQLTKIKEVFATGYEASTSAPQKLLLARNSTVSASPVALSTGESDEEEHPSTSALSSVVVTCTAAGTQPQRAKKYLALMGFNAIGGLNRQRFPFGEEPVILGNTADDGEVSLSGFTGTTAGVIGAHIKYETV
jgi:hypothetical protein